jgi:prephenate dehydratase/chorismate mutase/prephenate dehydratase
MTLNELRDDIDKIDARILALLGERMEKAILTRKLKVGGIEDKGREQEIIDKVRRTSRCLVRPDFAAGLYERIMAESKALQASGVRTVGFQGEHGAYSEIAARGWEPAAATIPCREFSDVFDGVDQGLFDYGIVPVENSLGGLVGPVNSILISTDLRVVAAVNLTVVHCLVAPSGADHRELRTVYSHSQALAQCRRFLERNKLAPLPYYDTAGAARMLAQEAPKGAAAIASRFAAELYDLDIIKEGIQDAPNNRTRFLVLSKKDSGEAGEKCSAVFGAEDKAGGLFDILQIFAREGINLTRIESVPNRPGDYAIFIDFEGSIQDERVARAVESATKAAQDFRILGCYKERRL